jgi:hypothetical protein
VRGTTAAPKAKRCPFTQAARRSSQPTRVESGAGSGSLIRAGRPRTVTPATSSTLAERATRRRGRRQATTLGGVAATTAVRITHRRRNPRGPVCLAGRSARQTPQCFCQPTSIDKYTGEMDPRV